jgi:hypothetical protein
MDGTIDWEKMRCNSTEAPLKRACCGIARYTEGRANGDFCICYRLRRFDARCPVESGVALLIDGVPSERVMGRAVLGAGDKIDGLLKSTILLHATYAGIAQVLD